jgi:hypothetical protein
MKLALTPVFSRCVAKSPLHNLTILLIKRNSIPNNLLHTLVFKI